MKEEEIKETWQYSELKGFFEEHSKEPDLNSKSVFLMNPSEKNELDKIIRNDLWPGVLKGVGTSGIWIKALEGTFPKSGIEDEKYPHTSRSITFLLEDPRRQISHGSDVPWYCRVKIQCSTFDYMVSFDFFVYFQENFSFPKITRLLKNPKFAGYPPELSYNKLSNVHGVFCLSFKKGSGTGWGIRTYQDATNSIREDITKVIGVIRALYDLEQDYKNTKAFNELEEALVEVFGSE